MAVKNIKGCSTSPDIREMQIKTTKRYYYTSIRTVKFEKRKITEIVPNVSEDTEKLNFSYTTGGIVKWNSHFYSCLEAS